MVMLSCFVASFEFSSPLLTKMKNLKNALNILTNLSLKNFCNNYEL